MDSVIEKRTGRNAGGLSFPSVGLFGPLEWQVCYLKSLSIGIALNTLYLLAPKSVVVTDLETVNYILLCSSVNI